MSAIAKRSLIRNLLEEVSYANNAKRHCWMCKAARKRLDVIRLAFPQSEAREYLDAVVWLEGKITDLFKDSPIRPGNGLEFLLATKDKDPAKLEPFLAGTQRWNAEYTNQYRVLFLENLLNNLE